MTESVRDFADKVMRNALLKTDNLRDFLSAAVPQLAGGFDFARAQPVPTHFLLPDSREREADLLFEIPYRHGDVERLALVCLLIDHQTRADSRMALRALLYIVLYWEKKWSEWEKLPAPRPEFRLPPVLPIVFHTGAQHWGSARTIAELLDEPEAFHAFAPKWAPLFWELPEHTVDELLSAEQAFLQALAVVRVEDADRAEFEQVYRATITRLNTTVGMDRSRWADLIYLVVGWIIHRRPKAERTDLIEIAHDLAGDVPRREEVRNMVETYADELLAEGERKGKREGERKGKLEGSTEQTRKLIIRLASKRLGTADGGVSAALDKISDVERLERMCENTSEARSWAELLATT